MIGTKLAHYEITSHLGTGGMGEVYQATDSRLGRSIAIKLLPEAFTHDAERASRFEREARVLASLNHPNIAAIHGVEESGGRKFLVMELVPGETLAERIRRGAIPLEEALGIATQITEALEAAHEKGVIHRDLRPANMSPASSQSTYGLLFAPRTTARRIRGGLLFKSRRVSASGAKGWICSWSFPRIIVWIRQNSCRFLLLFAHV
jgi:aminoglycoside phosphotransferase (APT) family kinase protein